MRPPAPGMPLDEPLKGPGDRTDRLQAPPLASLDECAQRHAVRVFQNTTSPGQAIRSHPTPAAAQRVGSRSLSAVPRSTIQGRLRIQDRGLLQALRPTSRLLGELERREAGTRARSTPSARLQSVRQRSACRNLLKAVTASAGTPIAETCFRLCRAEVGLHRLDYHHGPTASRNTKQKRRVCFT